MKNTRVCICPSVYDALKYFIETVTPSAFSKIILSHSSLSYNSFCVNIFSKNFLLFLPHLTISQWKILLNIRNCECFVNTLCITFLFLEIVLVYWHCIKSFKFVFFESPHATVKYFIKYLKFWMFLKQKDSAPYSCLLKWLLCTNIG